MCPDFFHQNAQDIAQNARKNAPALNVNFFIAFLDGLGLLFENFDLFYSKINYILLHKILKKSKYATIWVFLHCARFKNRCAREVQNAPFSRKITTSGHTELWAIGQLQKIKFKYLLLTMHLIMKWVTLSSDRTEST